MHLVAFVEVYAVDAALNHNTLRRLCPVIMDSSKFQYWFILKGLLRLRQDRTALRILLVAHHS